MDIAYFFDKLIPAEKAEILAAGDFDAWIAMVYVAGANPHADTVVRWSYAKGIQGSVGRVSHAILGSADSLLINALLHVLVDGGLLSPETRDQLLIPEDNAETP